MKLYLHIGNHKTGSTTIQNSLQKESSVLLSQHSLLYPETFLARGAHHLLPATLLNDKTLFGEKIKVPANNLIEKFKDELKRKQPQTVFISSEEFFRFHRADMNKLKPIFTLFDEVEILVYLRNQLDLIESNYKFGVLWEFSKNSNDFSSHLARNLDSNYHCFDQRLSGWREANPHSKINVRDFNQEISNSFLNNFYTSVLNVNLTPNEEKDNASLSRLSSLILRTVNTQEHSTKRRRRCIKSLFILDKDNPYLKKQKLYTQSQFTDTIDKFHQSNIKLKTDFGVDLNISMNNINKEMLVGEELNLHDLEIIKTSAKATSCLRGRHIRFWPFMHNFLKKRVAHFCKPANQIK